MTGRKVAFGLPLQLGLGAILGVAIRMTVGRG